MPEFIARSRVEAPAEEVFAWHARPGAFERLQPPWAPVEILERRGAIRDGDRLVLRLRAGPLRLRWVAEHEDYREGLQFADVQVAGPFARWRHLHRFETEGPRACRIEDRVEYAPPFGPLGRLLMPGLTRRLRRVFAYRHAVVRGDLLRHRSAPKKNLRIAVSGASGLVGSALVPFLTAGGHSVLRLVRRPAGEGEAGWDPDAGRIEADKLEGCDAVVHLAGESIAARWTPAKKARILDSRVRGTRLVAEALAGLKRRPAALVCASAIGFYGNRTEPVDESSASGTGFQAEVCREWEAAAAPAAEAGIRTVSLRFGIILSPAGGALAKMLPPFRLGAGGPVGSGRQPMSWVAIDDVLGAIHFAIQRDVLSGPVNATAPGAVSNRDFARTLGRVLGRPAFAPLPAFMVRLLFGEMGRELLLEGALVRPARLQAAGFEFLYPELEPALRHVLGR